MTTYHPTNRLESTLERCLDPDKTVTITVDVSGINVADPGEWITERELRDSLKVHIAVDFKSKQIVAIDVTDERTG